MINLLPQQEKLGIRREYHLRLATVCLYILTFISVLACILLLPPYVTSSSRESALQEQLDFMSVASPDVSLADLNVFIEKINTTLSLFDSTTPSRDVYKNILLPVLSARGASITISQFLYSDRGGSNGGVLELHGVASNRATLQAFKTTLENTGKFTSVDVPISNFVKRANIDFTISLYME